MVRRSDINEAEQVLGSQNDSVVEHHDNDVLNQVMRLLRLTRRASPREGHHSHSAGRLMHIVQEKPQVSSGELAELLDVRPSSLSEMLDRLEEQGTVQRMRDSADSRVIRVALTEHGLKQIRLNEDAMRAYQEEYSSCFSEEERELFCRLCTKLSDHLGRMQRRPHEEHRHHRKRGDRT